jgi:hypothetical protein
MAVKPASSGLMAAKDVDNEHRIAWVMTDLAVVLGEMRRKSETLTVVLKRGRLLYVYPHWANNLVAV